MKSNAVVQLHLCTFTSYLPSAAKYNRTSELTGIIKISYMVKDDILVPRTIFLSRSIVED